MTEQKDLSKLLPNAEESAQFRELLEVDVAVYDFFRAKFNRTWHAVAAADPTLQDELATLRCLNSQLALACSRGDESDESECVRAYLADSLEYTIELHEHGGYAHGNLARAG